MAYNKPISRMTDEEFEEHLRKLAAMSQEEKRKYAKRIDEREEKSAAVHAQTNRDKLSGLWDTPKEIAAEEREFRDEYREHDPDI